MFRRTKRFQEWVGGLNQNFGVLRDKSSMDVAPKKSNSPLCSFCKEEDETVLHVYFYCPNVRNPWNQLNFFLVEDLTLPPLTLQANVFGFS